MLIIVALLRMDNLAIVIFGDVPRQKLVDQLLKFEDQVLGDTSSTSSLAPSPPLRPFSGYCDDLTVPIQAEVKFPSVDEEFGMVEISWRVGDTIENGYKYTALSYLLDFLTEKIISPFSKGLPFYRSYW